MHTNLWLVTTTNYLERSMLLHGLFTLCFPFLYLQPRKKPMKFPHKLWKFMWNQKSCKNRSFLFTFSLFRVLCFMIKFYASWHWKEKKKKTFLLLSQNNSAMFTRSNGGTLKLIYKLSQTCLILPRSSDLLK